MKMIMKDKGKSTLVAFSLAASMLLGGCMGDSADTTGAGITTTNGNTTIPSQDQGGGITPTPDGGSVPGTQTSNAVLYWQAPATNTDGSPLIDLQGYKVYAGSTAADLRYVTSVSATATSYTVNNLGAGTYYFAVSAYNQAGGESAFSNVASKTVTN